VPPLWTPEVRWRAPGRVNLIGEHTDYNDGLALPFALAQSCVADVRRADDGAFTASSAQLDEPVVLATLEDVRTAPSWVRYVLGCAWVLADRGADVPPLQVHIDSDVPSGAGLSSSAAVVCAVTTALVDLLGLDLDADELLAATRAVENDVVGAPTGGLDQMASLRCRPEHALLCDFRDLSTRQVPLPLADHGLALLVLDTRTEHSHADGAYAARRDGCTRAAQVLGVESLREVDVDGLDAALGRLDDEGRRYVRHVVTENDRVRQVVDLLDAGRVGDVGPLLIASHASLRDDYRVTVPELDVAADTLVEAGALGARMTGGGFGGCVIALLPEDRVEPAAEAVRSAFGARGFGEPRHVVARPSAGAHAEDPTDGTEDAR
jgi:galactokinase